MSDTTGSLNTNGRSVNKKIFPSKRKGSILAKKNGKGKLVTLPTELKQLYLETYVNRLRHRKTKTGFEELKSLKEYLCSIRLEVSSHRKSSPLIRNKFENVLKCLKNNKARDPHGLVNEMFQLHTIGNDLKESLFLMFIRIKEEKEIPEIIKFANLTSIYKGKGEKNSPQN